MNGVAVKASEVPTGSLVFVDASAWVALIHESDRWYSTARAVFAELLTRQCDIVSLTVNFYEAVSVLNSERPYRTDWIPPAGKPNPFPAALVEFCRSAGVLLRNLESQQAWLPVELVVAAPTRRWSPFDCAAFLHIQREGIPYALAFDRHFIDAASEFEFEVIEAP